MLAVVKRKGKRGHFFRSETPKNYRLCTCNCSACDFTIFFTVTFYQTLHAPDKCYQDCRNYVQNNISGKWTKKSQHCATG